MMALLSKALSANQSTEASPIDQRSEADRIEKMARSRHCYSSCDGKCSKHQRLAMLARLPKFAIPLARRHSLVLDEHYRQK